MGRGERSHDIRVSSHCLVLSQREQSDQTTLCTAQGSLTQGSPEPIDYSYQDQWISLVCLAEVFNLVCMGFLPPFFVLCVELVLGPLFCSEFICFPTNMCISGALKLSLQTMPPYPAQQPGGGVISALMCPGLG